MKYLRLTIICSLAVVSDRNNKNPLHMYSVFMVSKGFFAYFLTSLSQPSCVLNSLSVNTTVSLKSSLRQRGLTMR